MSFSKHTVVGLILFAFGSATACNKEQDGSSYEENETGDSSASGKEQRVSIQQMIQVTKMQLSMLSPSFPTLPIRASSVWITTKGLVEASQSSSVLASAGTSKEFVQLSFQTLSLNKAVSTLKNAAGSTLTSYSKSSVTAWMMILQAGAEFLMNNIFNEDSYLVFASHGAAGLVTKMAISDNRFGSTKNTDVDSIVTRATELTSQMDTETVNWFGIRFARFSSPSSNVVRAGMSLNQISGTLGFPSNDSEEALQKHSRIKTNLENATIYATTQLGCNAKEGERVHFTDVNKILPFGLDYPEDRWGSGCFRQQVDAARANLARISTFFDIELMAKNALKKLAVALSFCFPGKCESGDAIDEEYERRKSNNSLPEIQDAFPEQLKFSKMQN